MEAGEVGSGYLAPELVFFYTAWGEGTWAWLQQPPAPQVYFYGHSEDVKA